MAKIPERIQRKRTKGWRMPENTVSVTRRGQFGNPFRVGGWFKLGDPNDQVGPLAMIWSESYERAPGYTLIETPTLAVEFYRRLVTKHPPPGLDQLRGKNLACFCPLDQPCHADVLLELANA